MAKYLTLNDWLETTFTKSSRPSMKTVYRWIKKNPAMARKIGGKLYIVETADVIAPLTSPTQHTRVQEIAAML